MTRAVVVTGASSGIGRSTALYLDSQGFHVFAGVRRDEDAEALRKQGSERLRTVSLELSSSASIDAMAKTLEQGLAEAGLLGLDGLVNNAGIGVFGPLEYVDLDELRRQLEVNVVAQLAVTQALLPWIRKLRGRVVNVGSIGGRMAAPMLGPYAASKFAMEGLTDALRIELAPFGIRVSLVEPGAIATEMFEKGDRYAELLVGHLPAEARARYGSAIRAVRTASAELARTALPPERVARVIHRALTTRRPRSRYLVGGDAKIQALARRFLPDRWTDFALAWIVRYPRRVDPDPDEGSEC